jgi:hypothetical protein
VTLHTDISRCSHPLLCPLRRFPQGLRAHADDPELQAAWRSVKESCKERAARKILELTGVQVSTKALFDVQVGGAGWGVGRGGGKGGR